MAENEALKRINQTITDEVTKLNAENAFLKMELKLVKADLLRFRHTSSKDQMTLVMGALGESTDHHINGEAQSSTTFSTVTDSDETSSEEPSPGSDPDISPLRIIETRSPDSKDLRNSDDRGRTRNILSPKDVERFERRVSSAQRTQSPLGKDSHSRKSSPRNPATFPQDSPTSARLSPKSSNELVKGRGADSLKKNMSLKKPERLKDSNEDHSPSAPPTRALPKTPDAPAIPLPTILPPVYDATAVPLETQADNRLQGPPRSPPPPFLRKSAKKSNLNAPTDDEPA